MAMDAHKDMEAEIRARIEDMHEKVPNSIGDQFRFRLVSCDIESGLYTLQCRTQEWMRNPAGILHGGMGATILDQAMGFIAFCAKPKEGISPTVQLNVTYHRPLIPGEDVVVRVKLLSVTRSLINLSAEAAQASSPERICLTGSATCFCKHTKPLI